MKNIIKIIFVSLISVGLVTSCTDLEIDPSSSVTPESFYSVPANFLPGLFGIYDALQAEGMYGSQIVLDAMSDNCATFDFLGDFNIYQQGLPLVVAQRVGGYYQDPYVLIQRANLWLDNIEKVTTGITDADRTLMTAEARGLRAIAYMRLVYLFGDVPLLTTSVTREESLALSRTDRDTIVDFVLTEFDEAAIDLDNTSSEGRLTKQALLGLRARVMLYEARLSNQTWPAALTAIELSITESFSVHGLVDTGSPTQDYQSLFLESGEGNSEYIFSVKNSEIDLDPDSNYKELFSWDAGALFLEVHQNLADAYPYADGSEYDPADDTFDGRDPRLDANIMHPGLTFGGTEYELGNGFVSGNSGTTRTGLFPYKFSSTDHLFIFNLGQLDVPVIRYAELLLMQAEALNETAADGHAALNQVRDRAGLPALAGLSTEAFREAVIHERRLEFPFEGIRWFDLITSGLADEVINAIDEPGIPRAYVSGLSELLPIPQSEIELNPNLLPNNPGY